MYYKMDSKLNVLYHRLNKRLNLYNRFYDSGAMFAVPMTAFLIFVFLDADKTFVIGASCAVITASGFTIWDIFFGFKAKELRKIKVEIARMEGDIPSYIPDKQAFKYLRKKRKKEKKKTI